MNAAKALALVKLMAHQEPFDPLQNGAPIEPLVAQQNYNMLATYIAMARKAAGKKD